MPGGALRGDRREASSVYLCNLESDADEGVDFKACPKPVGFYFTCVIKDLLEYV